MRIYGVDFTSRPRPAKPITVAECDFEPAEAGQSARLVVRELLRISALDRFAQALHRPGPWVAGMDFPFSQSRRLVSDLGWPDDWESLARHVATMEPARFADLLDLYRAAQPTGHKEPKRATDRKAKALPPMKLYGTPVGKMFHVGAPALAASGASVLPLRPADPERVVLEAYPALVARHLLGPRRSYKAETKRKQTDARRKARRTLVTALVAGATAKRYGFPVQMSRFCATALVDDAKGDLLDAVLCAVQAAWAWTRREDGWGIPAGCDRLEGWIVDPCLLG